MGSSKKKRSARASKRSSQEFRRVGPGVMGNVAGDTIDPDTVSGEDGRALDGAMDRYEVFHAKKPLEVVEVHHDPPQYVCCVGYAMSTSYRTDKWYGDGADIDYKHLHDAEEGRPYHYDLGEGVKLYENAALCSPKLLRSNGRSRLKYPKAWTRLGLFLGSDMMTEGGVVQEIDANKSASNCWLLCSPSGDMLAIYSPLPQADGSEGFLAFMSGGALRVIKDGIDG